MKKYFILELPRSGDSEKIDFHAKILRGVHTDYTDGYFETEKDAEDFLKAKKMKGNFAILPAFLL